MNFDITQRRTSKKKIKKEERKPKWLGSYRHTNIRIIGIPEEGEMEKWAESLFKEIIFENFPKLGRDLDIQVNKANKSSH